MGRRGQGKVVDLMTARDLVARFGGGSNAGHTIYVKAKYVTHILPSGIVAAAS
jgi:adenylosuccinate synthase